MQFRTRSLILAVAALASFLAFAGWCYRQYLLTAEGPERAALVYTYKALGVCAFFVSIPAAIVLILLHAFLRK